jgi:hypothetical protein
MSRTRTEKFPLIIRSCAQPFIRHFRLSFLVKMTEERIDLTLGHFADIWLLRTNGSSPLQQSVSTSLLLLSEGSGK